MKHIFVVNTFGKDNVVDIYRKIKSVAERHGLDYEIEMNSRHLSTDIILKSYQKGQNIIYAVGGDGMINKVLNSIVGTDNILSYIPYGTGNDLDKTVIETLEDEYNDVDIAKINDKYFINVACFGIDADIANDERFIHNKMIPKSQRYNAGVLYHFLKYKPRHMKVKFEDETIDDKFSTVVVANARYYGGGYKIGASSLIDDGKLNVYLADDLNKISMAKLITSTRDGSHENNKHVRKILTDKLTIECDNIIGSNIDGEAFEGETFNIEVIRKGIKLYHNQELKEDILGGHIKAIKL